jgi:hypothetical protein
VAAGRPCEFNDYVADKIVGGLAELNLYRLCKSDEFPARSTVLRWMENNIEFATRCARADQARAQKWATLVEETAETCTEENATAARVKISAFQWLASKEDAKYGDRQEVKHSGALTVNVLDEIIHGDDTSDAG